MIPLDYFPSGTSMWCGVPFSGGYCKRTAAAVRNTPANFQRVSQSMHFQAEACVASKANILSTYFNPNSNGYLLWLERKTEFLVKCCLISWKRSHLLLITFSWQCLTQYVLSYNIKVTFATEVLLLQATWWLCISLLNGKGRSNMREVAIHIVHSNFKFSSEVQKCA